MKTGLPPYSRHDALFAGPENLYLGTVARRGDQPSAILAFNDAGAGVVGINGSGIGAGTFTRATAATTWTRDNQYLYCPSTVSNFATAPDAARFTPTGVLRVRMKAAAFDWTPAAVQRLNAQWEDTGNQRSWIFNITTSGALQLILSRDGVEVSAGNASSAAVAFADGAVGYVGATYDPVTSNVMYETSTDGIAWTQLGTIRSFFAGVGGQLFDSSAPLSVGSYDTGIGGANGFAGKIFWATVDVGAGIVSNFDVRQAAYKATSWTSTTGEVWTITQTAPNPAALVQAELISVASGSPRFYYDPVTGTADGYLPEAIGINIEQRHNDFNNAWWTKTDTTVTSAAILGPDGTVSLDLITEGSAGTASVQGTNRAITADVSQAVQRVFKRGNHDWVFLFCQDSTSANAVGCYFNLGTGAVGTATNTGTASAAAGTIKALPNGLFLCTVTGIVGGGFTSARVTTRSASADNSATRVANGTRYETGAMHEDNVTEPSSLIQTVGASLQRNADVLSYTPGVSFGATEGALYAEYKPTYLTGTTTRTILHINGGTLNDAFYLGRMQVDGSQNNFIITVATVPQYSANAGAVVAGTPYKMAANYSAAGARMARNGTLQAGSGAISIPTVTSINVGHLIGSFQARCPIKQIRLYNKKPSDEFIRNVSI